MTAKELAKKLHLSEAAVSMALNNKPGVSTETRKAIVSAAQKYGYDFSRINFKKSTGDIHFVLYRKHGAVVSETPFFFELTQGVETTCKKQGFRVSIKNIYDNENLQRQFEELCHSGCCGVILLGTEMQAEDYLLLGSLDLPIVLLDSNSPARNFNSIQIGNMNGACHATAHLIQQRKAQPGYLHSSYPITNFDERADGFYKAIRKNGLSTSKSIIHALAPSVEGAHADMLAILDGGDEIASCYFADNDLIAAGAMRALKERGYKIPEDIAIIGFDDMPLCTYVEPNLTTIHVPKKYMGQLAAERLIHIINTHDLHPVTIQVATTLVERASL